MAGRVPIICAALLLGLSACAGKPIYNVVSHPIPPAARSLSLQQIESNIVEAGQSRGWRFESQGQGRMRARQEMQKYGASVDIAFDQSSYSIAYVSSYGFKERGDTVHPHYNSWIRNLQSDIDSWLASAAMRR